MKKAFGARRVPRKIGQDDEEDRWSKTQDEDNGLNLHAITLLSLDLTSCKHRLLTRPAEPVVKRPTLTNKPKKSSALRMSFGPDEAHDSTTGDEVELPKKKSLGRLTVERNAERSLSSENLPLRAGQDHDRPSYSKEYLAELAQSTPSTPRNFSSRQTSEEADLDKALDVRAKFGSLAKYNAHPSILSAAEIKERKERRARLAKEQAAEEFISLDDEDNYDLDEESGQLILPPKQKYAETRLIPDDEDFAEGFDDFTEDGRVPLGRRAEKEAKRKRRKEMEEAIAEAEGGGGEEGDEDDSEAERNAAYDAAQARKGTYGQRQTEDEEWQRPRTPPKITPIPTLGDIVEKLKEAIEAKKASIAAKQRRHEELMAEKEELTEREVWIQQQLNEAAERYEKLKVEAGLPALNETEGGQKVNSLQVF